MYIIDSHCDSIQSTERHKNTLIHGYNFSNKCPQLQFVAMFHGWPKEDAKQSYDRAAKYVGQFELAKVREDFIQVKTYADIERAFKEGKHACMLTTEGGDGYMGSRDILRNFYEVGVRVSGLAWNSNDMAMCNHVHGDDDTGLTDIGREIVDEGNKLGMIFDVSHLSDKSFWDLAAIAKKPIVATHSNFRTLCDASRNLTDDMAKEIIRQGGMIGLNLCTAFVGKDCSNDALLDHIDYCISLGGEDNIGFGCDIDGIGGYPGTLNEESSIHDQLIDLMKKRGYSDELIEKVAYKNWLNYLKKNLD